MPGRPPLSIKTRTGVLTNPSSSKGETSMNRSQTCGTWSTCKLVKKKSLKVSRALNEDPIVAMMDSLITGPGLTSDLNTPDIKFEDLGFKYEAINSHNGSNMEVDSSLAAFAPTVNVLCSSSDDESLSAEAPTSGDCYSLFDMSPGSRDVLQADQQEHRVNIKDYVGPTDGGDHDDNNRGVTTFKSCPPSIINANLNYSSLQPQFFSETPLGNGLGVIPLQQPQIMDNGLEAIPLEAPQLMEYDDPPQLSIGEDDFNFAIPQDMLEQMESLFPEEKLIAENPVTDNVNSTELDMYLGTQGMMDGTDILAESLEVSGFLTQELEAFLNEDTTLHQGSNTVIQAVLPMQGTAAHASIAPTLVMTDQSLLETQIPSTTQTLAIAPSTIDALLETQIPSTTQTLAIAPSTIGACSTPSTSAYCSTPSKTGACPRAPSKKRRQQQDEVTPSVCGSKRLRRAAKKPLRFRQPETLVEFDTEPVQHTTEVLSALCGSKDVGNIVEIDDIKDELDIEEELDNNEAGTSRGKRSRRNSTQKLTEEEKYHRIRVLNNEASKRCRQKRKQTVKVMEEEMMELQERNEVLKKKHEALVSLKDKFQSFVNDYFKKRLSSN